MWDFNTLTQLADNLPGNSSLQNLALTTANEIMNVFRHDDPSTITKSRKVAEKVFGKGWEEKGAGVYKVMEGNAKVNIWGIGHCELVQIVLLPLDIDHKYRPY